MHSHLKQLLAIYIKEHLPLTDRAHVTGVSGRRLCKASFVDILNILNYYLTDSRLD